VLFVNLQHSGPSRCVLIHTQSLEACAGLLMSQMTQSLTSSAAAATATAFLAVSMLVCLSVLSTISMSGSRARLPGVQPQTSAMQLFLMFRGITLGTYHASWHASSAGLGQLCFTTSMQVFTVLRQRIFLHAHSMHTVYSSVCLPAQACWYSSVCLPAQALADPLLALLLLPRPCRPATACPTSVFLCMTHWVRTQ
jgi:hypothetical protein